MTLLQTTTTRLILKEEGLPQEQQVSLLVHYKTGKVQEESNFIIIGTVLEGKSTQNEQQQLTSIENLVISMKPRDGAEPFATTLIGHASIDMYPEALAKRLSKRMGCKITLSINGNITSAALRQSLEKKMVDFLLTL